MWLFLLLVVGGLLFVLFGRRGINVPREIDGPRRSAVEEQMDRDLERLG